ncbi:MAG: hypothetical protein KHX55_06650, partial [Proteobacteria bacterium]|nr:hypothetical protein [Pseudomonadota bacterium]
MIVSYNGIEYDIITPISRDNVTPEIIDRVKENYNTASTTQSPLAIDLDGDGVETVGTDSRVFFDHDGNGFAENTGWIGKDDGILVRDINNNGQVDSGAELFGNNSALSTGQKAANGFEALKDLDSNHDGVFNNQDAAWNEVKVWKDANQDGDVDTGELMTLEQAGIAGINLSYNQQNTTDANGNTHAQVGTIIKTDGTSGTVTDVWFDADYANTIDKTEVTIPDDIKALPEVEGFGNVHSLQAAMALDSSGALKTLVQQFMAETDIVARDAILNNLIYHWAGVQDMDPNGRDPTQVYGKVIDDTRKVEALEEFLGEDYLGTWCWGERDPNPHGQAAPLLLKAFDDLKEYVNQQLLSQSHYKTLLESIQLTYDDQTETWSANVDGAVAALRTLYNQDNAGGLAVLQEFAKLVSTYGNMGTVVIDAFRAQGNVEGSSFDTELTNFALVNYSGTSGNDTIEGDDGANYLLGQGGNDRLFGNGGNDILIGGSGDDYLNGGNGADTYRFEAGFGNDTLDNNDDNASADEPDVVEFGEGIFKENVSIERQGFDLILRVSYDADENGYVRADDTLRIYSYFNQQGTTAATVNSIKFADGTSWDYNYVIANWNSVPGAGGGVTLEGDRYDNTMNGTAYDDIFIGHAGVDTINGKAGNDRIMGGRDDDNLNGGDGDDIYIWNLGDGMDTINDSGNHDRISFGSGITYEDLKFRQEGNNLRIIVKNDETQGMLIVNFFYRDSYQIEELYFYDGKLVNLTEAPLVLQQFNTAETIELTNNGDTVYGNGGFDTINGGSGNDTIVGGKGNDSLSGSYGNDTYIWNLGDGMDTISDNEGENVIQLGGGISLSDLTFSRNVNNLNIIVNGEENQGITIANYFIRNDRQKYTLNFADGSSVNLAQVGLTLQQGDSDDNISTMDYDDVIYGNGGNDTIYSNGGNDIIIGGKGNDVLYGSYGNDTYIWNLGDGMDTISDNEGENVIQLGGGISLSNLTFSRDVNNLNIIVNGEENQGITIANYFIRNDRQKYTLKFADGSSVNLAQVGLTLQQGDSDDNISTMDYDDVIYGNGGNDTIYSNGGNDIIIGGKGNDVLYGSYGNDTYIWNLGDGLDTISDNEGENVIQLGDGISLSDLTFSRDVNNLVIVVKGEENQGIIIADYFTSSSRQKQTIEFADGSNVNLAQVGLT